MQITEDLRIRRFVDRNLILEKYTEGLNPKTKAVTKNWKVIGYYGNVKQVLRAILERELLTDINTFDTLELYLETIIQQQDELINRCERLLVRPIEYEFKNRRA